MYDDLKGKTVVVTGSSKGLGAAMARRFGAEGMNVVANYRSDEEGARETVRAIEEAGGAAAAVQADVSKDECVDALFDAAMFSFGGVDIWV
ncbi:MAG: SDR family NAD(P)-dependent oxidoreductase, partial [Eggerthella sp.]|nr:SDR family NAD(P)-dependent oxidoreductase [Eggerthella sp.]